MKLNCPACGAEVVFKSRASVFGVCSFCSSTLVRHDMQIENIGKMTDMPQDMSPLQLGTVGQYDGSQFEIVGRQKIGWTDGNWNEWYIHLNNGQDGWLADAQGNYMVSFQVFDFTFPKLGMLELGSLVSIKGVEFSVEDIREVTCLGSQGEMPIKSVKGRKSTSVDLVGQDGQFANIDYAADENRAFLGKYKDFEELQLANLREIDGW